MHFIFPNKIENWIRYLKLKFLPKTLFFRTMLLIFIPLVVVQAVSIVAFFDGSWKRIGWRLSDNLTSEMAFIIEAAEANPGVFPKIQALAEKKFGLKSELVPDEKKFSAISKAGKNSKLATGFLEGALERQFPNTGTAVSLSDGSLEVFINTPKGLFKFTTSSKNIFTTSYFGFVIWMIGTSMLLFLVAVLFLRVQVRSIAELAQVAEEFGRGIDNKRFKPYGSSEVRRAAIAFIKMKERIQKHISERTQMLAGVSHDLRTPLTRMKLQVEMLRSQKDKEEFFQDILEMEKMLDGYLSFVSGEGGEKSSFVDINAMISGILSKFRNKNALIKYLTNNDAEEIQGREQALKRAITNVISNAFDYGKTIAVKLENTGHSLDISVEDDGPGIPKGKRNDVFKAFYRLETSRNKETGGVGLGLSIAKDVITSHGGRIELQDSELGGLKVFISLPFQSK